MKRQWLVYACAILLVVNLVLTGLLLGGVLPEEDATTSRYTLYIGMSDKDTGTQLIPTEEALQIVGKISANYVPGYTATTGYGGWYNAAGEFIQEESLIFTFIDAEEEKILKIRDEAMEALNQASIMVEYQEVESTLYTR